VVLMNWASLSPFKSFKRFKPFKPLPHSSPAIAGEDKGGGVERSAQKLRRRRISLGLRLNSLNAWNPRSHDLRKDEMK